MRRVWYFAFLLCVLVCGLLLFVQRGKSKQSREEPDTGTPTPARSAVPRLAYAVLTGPDADPPRLDSDPSPGEAKDAGRLVLDEQTLMQQIRDTVRTKPKLAEALAREGRERFPDSPDADERDTLLVSAVFNQHQLDRARIETFYYFKHHPGGHFSEYLTALTGVPAQAGQ